MNASEESGLDLVVIKTSTNKGINGENLCLTMRLYVHGDLGRGEMGDNYEVVWQMTKGGESGKQEKVHQAR